MAKDMTFPSSLVGLGGNGRRMAIRFLPSSCAEECLESPSSSSPFCAKASGRSKGTGILPSLWGAFLPPPIFVWEGRRQRRRMPGMTRWRRRRRRKAR